MRSVIINIFPINKGLSYLFQLTDLFNHRSALLRKEEIFKNAFDLLTLLQPNDPSLSPAPLSRSVKLHQTVSPCYWS